VTAGGRRDVRPDEAGALLAELMVASGLLVLGLMVVGATLNGPIRSMEVLALPTQRFEGVDRVGLSLATAVRAARPSLQRPAVLLAAPDHLVLALDHLVSRHSDAEPDPGRRWSLELVGTELLLREGSDLDLVVPVTGLRDVDPSRTTLRYFDAARNELDASTGLTGSALARISSIELHVVVLDPSGRGLEVAAVHRASLRISGPLG
jgi:hypothetical protein